MGQFSFICKVSGLPVSSSHSNSINKSGDACRLYLLKDGKVIEEMRGHYDGYGVVYDGKGGSFEWKMPWDDVCDLMFHDDRGNGIAAILEAHFNGVVPKTRSEDDPDQGWSDLNGYGVKIDNPEHILY